MRYGPGILRVIEEDGLAEEIDALVGPEVLVGLRTCQPAYQAMVQARLARDNRPTADLNRQRNKLSRAIARHCNAVLALLDEQDPDSLPMVLDALRPVEVFRMQAAAGTSTTVGSAVADDEAEASEDAELAPKA